MSERILYRLFFLVLSILLIPAIPIFVIFFGTSTPEYVISGTLNMPITGELHPFELYLASLRNLLSFNLGTSITSGEPVLQVVAVSFLESAKIMIPALVISLLAGIITLCVIRKNERKATASCWICSVPMVVFSYVSIFLVDRLGFDITSNLRYFIACVILSIYPAHVVHNAFARKYREIVRSDFYRFHLASGFSAESVLRRFLPKYFITEYLSVFEGIFIYMFGFIFFVESPLAINGAGNQFVRSIQRYDYPMIVGYCVFSIIILTAINLFVDSSLHKLDKRR